MSSTTGLDSSHLSKEPMRGGEGSRQLVKPRVGQMQRSSPAVTPRKKRHKEENLQQRLMHCFICSNLDSRSRLLFSFFFFFFYGFASIPVPIVTCLHGNSCVIVAEASDLKQSQEQLASAKKDQIWAGHQRAHIKELKHSKSSVLTFMASVYARSCTLTYTFLLCRVEGTHVSDGNVSCLVTSGLFSPLLPGSWHDSFRLF